MEEIFFDYTDFANQPRLVQQFIIKETLKEIHTQEQQLHSLQSIVAQNRMLAVGCRMIGRGTITINGKNYTGRDVADVYINSVANYAYSFYPITGDLGKANVRQLVLFVKLNGSKYVPYARFDIDEIIKTDTQPTDFNQHFSEKDFLINSGFRYKTVLKISNVQTTDLPKSFIGITSGMDVYDRAFHGSSPNILIL